MKTIRADQLEGQEVIRIDREWCRVVSTEKYEGSVTIRYKQDGKERNVTVKSDQLFVLRLDMQTLAVTKRLKTSLDNLR